MSSGPASLAAQKPDLGKKCGIDPAKCKQKSKCRPVRKREQATNLCTPRTPSQALPLTPHPRS